MNNQLDKNNPVFISTDWKKYEFVRCPMQWSYMRSLEKKKKPSKKEIIEKLENKVKNYEESNRNLWDKYGKVEAKMENYKDKFIAYKWLFRIIVPTLTILLVIFY